MKENKVVEFDGVVSKSVFESENFKIYGFFVDGFKFPEIKLNKYNAVTVLGNIHTLCEGSEYHIKAEERIGREGYEYKVINIKRDKPQTEHTTKMFLQEILESEQQVEELIREYPDIIDRVINNRLEDIDLSKLYNIGTYRFNVIKRRIIENFAISDLFNEFKGILDFKTCKVLLDKYTSIENVKNKLEKDPYKCLCGISGIAFKTADRILIDINTDCKKLKEKGENPPIDFTYDLLSSYQRQKAAIMFLLSENENNGNTKIDVKQLKKQSENLANKSIHHFVDVIKNDEDIYFDKNTMMVALKESFDIEQYIATRIIEGLKIENKWDIDKNKNYSKCGYIQLTDEQIKIIPMICDNNISILKGGAGMGKSQSTKAVINMLKDNNKSFVIFAPTGRASKVISEFTNESASTIHKGLCYMPPDWGFNEECPLTVDIVIVDESSMIDIFLMKHLIEAINFEKTKMLFIGDSDQIPSVGAGNVFYDMINSGIIPINTLTKVFRYGTGGILTVATNTRECKKFLYDSEETQIFGDDKGYVFIPTQQEKIINKVLALYKKLLNSGYNIEDIMILSSQNIGEYGTIKLNQNLQPIANPNCKENKYIKIGNINFYENDLIIQTVNNYKAKVYTDEFLYSREDEEELTFIPNGEIGKIIEIRYNSVIIKFSNETVVYSREHMQNVKLAYSISTHKSQGGQARIIILITPKAHTYMLNSNLIYVGQTRAKEKVFHFGEINTVNKAIKKKADFNRDTFLLELLSKQQNKYYRKTEKNKA